MEEKGKSVTCGTGSLCRCKVVCGERAAGEGLDNPKMCRCGEGRCKILSSKKPHSYGRRFYCCPRSSGPNNHGCGMFEWVMEENTGRMSSCSASKADDDPISPSTKMTGSTSSYARGYLEASIRSSEQQTYVLKHILDAMKKLDVNTK